MWLFTAAWMLPGLAAQPAPSSAVDVPHVALQVVMGSQSIAPGGEVLAALEMRIESGWHVYWRNPGDIGQATSVSWTAPAGWLARSLPWPAPQLLTTGRLTTYIYAGRVTLVSAIDAGTQPRPNAVAHLAAHVSMLVCRDVCIPEATTLRVVLPVKSGALSGGSGSPDVARALRSIPQPWAGSAQYRMAPRVIELRIRDVPLAWKDAGSLRFFPYSSSVIDASAPQPLMRRGGDLILSLPQAQGFIRPSLQWALQGVVTAGDGQAYELSAGAVKQSAPLGATAAAGRERFQYLKRWLWALSLAVLGGLLLNVMPCVFPVLAIKIAALLRDDTGRREARRESVAYLVGTTVTFLALAAILLLLRASGRAIGWGFQMQSPTFVALTALVIFGAGLNLSGVMETGTSLQGIGASIAPRSRMLGSFLAGVLAVIVAAPCVVPFMAAAAGWAFTQPATVALPVFCALGVGLGLPAVMATLVPKARLILPRPGPWMLIVRQTLAFPMYVSSAWLIWIFATEAGAFASFLLLLSAIGVAFAAWLWGKAQGHSRLAAVKFAAVAALAASVGVAIHAASGGTAPRAARRDARRLQTLPWSAELVRQYQLQHRPVLVDFTASWCLTCKVNELTVLDSRPVVDVLRRTHAAFLKADWTSGNQQITAELTRLGHPGVPLYLLYDASGRLKILPQILTTDGVVSEIERASAP